MQISKEDMKKLENAFSPSPWVQRGIKRIQELGSNSTREERIKIFEEEKAKLA